MSQLSFHKDTKRACQGNYSILCFFKKCYYINLYDACYDLDMVLVYPPSFIRWNLGSDDGSIGGTVKSLGQLGCVLRRDYGIPLALCLKM
jgi:hypothetical protein